MKYERFEQLPVWKTGMTLAERVYALTRRGAFSGLGELRDQLRRAPLSVPNNVAEGFERGTTAELLSFLYIARGSAGEVRSMLLFCKRLAAQGDLKSQISDKKGPGDLKSRISDMKGLAESCSRQLRAWAGQLQDSDIAGPRRLNDRTRQAYDSARRADAFWQKLEDIRTGRRSPLEPD